MFSSALHEICKLWEVHSSSWIVALRRDVVADLWKPATSGILMKLQPESTHSPFRSIHLVTCPQFVDLIAKIREIRRNNLNKKTLRNAPGGGTGWLMWILLKCLVFFSWKRWMNDDRNSTIQGSINELTFCGPATRETGQQVRLFPFSFDSCIFSNWFVQLISLNYFTWIN